MISVHLYGKLRRFAASADPTSESVVEVAWEGPGTIADLVKRLGIPIEELGSNLFVNGRYATLETHVDDGDRLGLFPDDMQLLYKWYFSPNSSNDAEGASRPGDSREASQGSGTSESMSKRSES